MLLNSYWLFMVTFCLLFNFDCEGFFYNDSANPGLGQQFGVSGHLLKSGGVGWCRLK